MNGNLIWSLVLAAIGILGIYLAGSKNLWGWVVSFSAQVLWFIFAIVTKQYGFILSALAYGWVYGRNYLRWRKEHTTPSRAATEQNNIVGYGQHKVDTAVPSRLTPGKDIPKPKKADS